MESVIEAIAKSVVRICRDIRSREQLQHLTDPTDLSPGELRKITLDALPAPGSPGRLAYVELVVVGRVTPHPALYTEHLEFTRVYGLPLVVGKGEFTEGDIAIYVPLGARLPARSDMQFIHQGRNYVVQARRFRGVESCGVLLPATQFCQLRDHETGGIRTATAACWNVWLDGLVGADVSALLGIENPV